VRGGRGPRQGRKAASVTRADARPGLSTHRESYLALRHLRGPASALRGPASALYLKALARRRRDDARLQARRARRRLRRREQVEVGARDGVPRLKRPHHVARVPVRFQNLRPNTRSAPRRTPVRSSVCSVPPRGGGAPRGGPVTALSARRDGRHAARCGGGGALASMEQLPRIMTRQSDWSCGSSE